MRTPTRTTTGLAILFSAIAALAFAEPKARLIGKIIDPDGKPLQGVAVTATSQEIPSFRVMQTTDKKGAFIIDFTDINVTYRFRFEKAGYQTLAVDQGWHDEGTQRFTWTMAPGGATVSPIVESTIQPAVTAFNEGVTALKAKDLATAEAKFKLAVQHDPGLARAWAALSTVQVQTGHNQEAADAAEKAIKLGLVDETVLTARWQAYKNLKDDLKAAEALKQLETVGRRAEEAKKVHNEAVALAKAGDNAGAYAKFEEALKIEPALQPALIGLATAALKIGKNVEAATAAETILKADPKNEAALRLRYNAWLAAGDTDRLFDALVGLSQVEPATASKGLFKLAADAYDANDAARAKDRFAKILEIDPNQPYPHYYLAMVYVNEGSSEKARPHLERFIALAPNTQEAATAREILKQLKP